MRKVVRLFETSVGKKIFMAATGAILFGFVLVHMIGNLKIYQGADKFDSYARFLREFGYPALGHGQFLWIARLVLLGCVAVHMLAALQLTFRSRRARSTGYKKSNDLSFSYASRTMRWGGVILGAFVVYHLLHLTVGLRAIHPDFSHESAFANVVSGFQVWQVTVVYVLCMIPLGLHVYHGLWSATQTLALRNPAVVKWRRPVAAAIAALIVAGNISIPLSILGGLVG